jgi:hypothetical protein
VTLEVPVVIVFAEFSTRSIQNSGNGDVINVKDIEERQIFSLFIYM